MLRNAIYTEYKGAEYRVFRDRYGKYILVSLDRNDIKTKGFIKEDDSDDSAIIKEILPSQIGEVYSINTFGIYKGRKFPILEETDDQYMLGADDFIFDPEAAKKFGFDMYLRGEYHKWVDTSEVKQISEVKKLLPDFVR